MTFSSTHTNFRRPLCALLFGLIAVTIMLFGADGAGAASLRLGADPVPGTDSVVVKVAGAREATGVALYVDGQLIQRDRKYPWRFGRQDKIAVGGGRHKVSVSAKLPRHTDVQRAVVVQTPTARSNSDTPHLGESVPVKTPTTGSESTHSPASPVIPTAPPAETPSSPTTGAGPSSPPAAGSQLLFSPSYLNENSLLQWDLLQEAAPGRISIVPNPTQPTQHVARFEVRPTDQIGDTSPRAEVGKYLGEKEGEERWYGWETYFPESFPTNYPNSFITFTQWRAVDESEDYSSFMLWGNRIELRREGTQWSTTLTKNVWHKFVYHVRWSPDPSVGFIELFYDGQLVLPKTYVRTMGGTVANPVQNYVKQGLYKSEEIPTGVLYQSDFVSGTSYEAVNASS